MAVPPALLDGDGAPIRLGSELGRGGEAAVFDIVGRNDSAAKVYLQKRPRDHWDKLATMVGMAEPRVLKLTAWPTSTLQDRSGAVVGFVMPKVAGHRPVFQLYGPKLRLQQFPKADWRFLIAAAANAARAFSIIHEAGHVVGDVNHGNLVVSQDATVRMIDCDSFQIAQGARRWFCGVGVGTHQPPEMQKLASYGGIVRTPNHDDFGLAVIVFQLLCLARHPFSGRTMGPGEAPSIEEAIEGFRYAYSRDASRTRMAPPPGSLATAALGTTIEAMFELAFSPSVVRGGRPTAGQWATALERLGGSLARCRTNAGHWHLAGLSACPWCDIEARSGTALFPAVLVGSKQGTAGILLLWQQVTQLSPPAPLPRMPSTTSVQVSASPQATAIGSRRRNRRILAMAVALLGLAGTFALVPSSQRLLPVLAVVASSLGLFYWRAGKGGGQYDAALRAVRGDWLQLETAWSAKPPGPSFANIRGALDELKRKHDALQGERAGQMRKLWEARRQRQLSQHLDRFQIADARIGGIGKAKVATLQAHQIFTADDVDPGRIHSTQIPGFGPATKGKLVDWRRECEQSFRFDPNGGVYPADEAAVDRDIAQRGTRLEQDLASGLSQLRAIVANQALRRRSLEERAAELLPRLAQAEADAKAAAG